MYKVGTKSSGEVPAPLQSVTSAACFQDWHPQAPTHVKKQGKVIFIKVINTSQTNTARSGQQIWSRGRRERAK